VTKPVLPRTVYLAVLSETMTADQVSGSELTRWLKGGLPWLAERARIVLACAEPGSGVARVAAELGSTRMTVRKWRRRFAEAGLAGLADHDRPGRPVADLVLTGQERDQLTRWVRRAKTSQALALRARIVLAVAGGRRTSRPPRICGSIRRR
jgi:transposase-like protein